MANPRFYYYPDPSGSLEVIDLLGPLSSLIVTPIVKASEGYDGAGRASENLTRINFRVRIILDRFQTAGVGRSSLERQLLTMQQHLLAGGYVGFSKDHAKAWASLPSVSGALMRGDTVIPTGGNGFGAWSASAALTAGDELVIEQGAPYFYGEIKIGRAHV